MQHMFISNEQPTALWLTIDTTDDIDDVYIHACCEDSDGNYNELEGRRSYMQVARYAHKLAILKPNTGDVDLTVGTEGSISDTHRQPNGDRAFLSAGSGSVTVDNKGVGDVDLYEVYALKDAGISVADGDLHLVNASGELVAIFVKKPGKDMDVQNVEAATEIQISGSNMDLDSITQREDGDGFLTITPDGTSDDQPIDNLRIGDIKASGGVRFDRLWLTTGDIHVSEGALHLDKVYVEDKASFSTDAMKTDVFGSAPVFDESQDSVYWVDTNLNKPKDDLDAWKSGGTNGNWMYIHFNPQGAVQESNGNLLYLRDDNFVYSQRHSMADWMNIFEDNDFYDFYNKYYAPELSYHSRYNLIDGDAYDVAAAEADDLTVAD